MQQSTRLQRVERDLAAEQQQQDQKQKWPDSQQIPHPAFSLLDEIDYARLWGMVARRQMFLEEESWKQENWTEV